MKTENTLSTTRGERMAYGCYSFGMILVYAHIASFLQIYLTNSGITAVTVGVIFMIAKVWDAVNDPIFGVMVDKVRFKKDRYKPWLRIASMAIPVATILLFVIPSGASSQIKVIWASAAYVLWDTAYTMCDVPLAALATAMSESPYERNKLYSLAAFFTCVGGLLVAVMVPMLFPAIGWGMTSVIVAVLAFLSMLPLQFKTKERFAPPQNKEVSVTELFRNLFKNKYLLVFTLATIIGSTVNFTTSLVVYFATYCMGNEAMITPIVIAAGAPLMIVSLILPKLYTKADKFKIMIISRIINIFVDFIIYAAGYENVPLFIALVAIKHTFFAVWGVSGTMFVADCVEYGHFKTGQRSEGISFSVKAFTNKLIMALSGSLGMFALGAYGFVEGEGAVQSAETLRGMWNLFALWPAIGSIVAVAILLSMYKLKDKDVKLMIRANNGEISKDEAIAGFSREY